MKVWVTGATGLLGREVMKALQTVPDLTVAGGCWTRRAPRWRSPPSSGWGGSPMKRDPVTPSAFSKGSIARCRRRSLSWWGTTATIRTISAAWPPWPGNWALQLARIRGLKACQHRQPAPDMCCNSREYVA